MPLSHSCKSLFNKLLLLILNVHIYFKAIRNARSLLFRDLFSVHFYMPNQNYRDGQVYQKNTDVFSDVRLQGNSCDHSNISLGLPCCYQFPLVPGKFTFVHNNANFGFRFDNILDKPVKPKEKKNGGGSKQETENTII